MQTAITVEISPGELLDRLCILRIKSERIAEPAKLANVRTEYELLEVARRRAVPRHAELETVEAELQAINQALWDREDAIRACEREQDFGPRFIELARSLYRLNDRRASLKRRINEFFGSRLTEEKAYTSYLVDPSHIFGLTPLP